jgi:hypothetical protein
MKEVYSPYNVMVTDQRPTGGLSFTMGIVAGLPSEVGYPSSIGGLGPPGAICNPASNVISMSFANLFGGSGMARVYELCGVAAQETAHAFGLDHEYSYTDGTSACRSPMSYRGDCGGEKFFRGEPAMCGEYTNRPCRCGGLQNSHLRLLAVFGPGTPITAPPHVELVTPMDGAQVTNGAVVTATAGAQRGIDKIELWLNNHKWAETSGAAFGTDGQPDPSSYVVTFPQNVPDGVIDVMLKAYDDIAIETDSTTVTVTKGAPCTTAATCLKGQKCDAGKCYWDAATGQLGDACSYNEFCVSGICQGTSDTQICTQSCVINSADACPMGYDCIATSETEGICFTSGGGGGCCGATPGPTWPRGLLAITVGILLLRRRRR